MRVEQGVKISSFDLSITEDFKEGEIVIIEHNSDIEELYLVQQVINGSGIFHPIAFDALKKGMAPKIENQNLYFDRICDCYNLETAIEIAKALNDK